jgi:hypothetical protein
MNEHLKQGWIDIPMLTKLNRGGKRTSFALFCIDNSQRRLSARIRVESRFFLCLFPMTDRSLIHN